MWKHNIIYLFQYINLFVILCIGYQLHRNKPQSSSQQRTYLQIFYIYHSSHLFITLLNVYYLFGNFCGNLIWTFTLILTITMQGTVFPILV
jgi:hypothetical protein